MMKRSLLFPFLFVFLIPLTGSSQDHSTVFSPIAQNTVAKLIKIHGDYPSNGISFVPEINLNWTLRGERNWHKLYEHIEFGVSLSGADFGNSEILGQAFSAIPYFSLKTQIGDRSYLGGRMGFGVSLFNKPFDQIKNPENVVIGSVVNAAAIFNAYFERELNDKFNLIAGVNGFHYSNIHLKVPNIGANVLGVNIGLKYLLPTDPVDPIAFAERPSVKYPRFGIGAGMGLQAFRGTIRPADGPVYPVYTGQAFVMWPSGKRGFWSSGVIYNYMTSSYQFILGQDLDVHPEDAKKKSSNVVVFGAHEWMFGHFAFQLMVGINVYDPFTPLFNDLKSSAEDRNGLTRWTANKIGFKYYPMRHSDAAMKLQPVLGCAVKAAGGSADFLEATVGIVF
jgi:hypothetical protein